MTFRPCLRIALVALPACLALLGCAGGDGRHDVSGEATFQGKPIAVGRIYFDPDSVKNKTGLQGYAEIKDGKYDTAATKKGVTGGAYTVRIEAFDGSQADPDRPNGKPLFPQFRTEVELPKDRTTKSFDVPAPGLRGRVPTSRGYGSP